MRKDTITLQVAAQKTMRVSAYVSDDPPGLAVHRAVVWVPAKGEHKHISKWTVTHIKSGQSLLRPSDYLPTMKACTRLLVHLQGIDWTTEAEELRHTSRDIEVALSELKEGVQSEEEKEAPRYIIRRCKGVGYEVVDSSTDVVISVFAHRGLASSFAREKNERESL